MESYVRMKSSWELETYFGPNFQPQKGDIHVLVEHPSESAYAESRLGPATQEEVLRLTEDQHEQQHTEPYRAVAERLKNAEEVNQLMTAIQHVSQSKRAPFIVWSGMGKTQMAFNLMARDDVDVFYIVCGGTCEGAQRQPVYRAFGHRSAAFRHCVKLDLPRIEAGHISDIAVQGELYTYAFILAMLNDAPKFSGRQSFDLVCRSLQERPNQCVVFLDEFPLLDKDASVDEEYFLRSMRNVFRSIGLVVIVSSTNGTARGLADTVIRFPPGHPHAVYVTKVRDDDTSKLIKGHYAYLSEHESFELNVLRTGALVKNEEIQPWKYHTEFPPVDQDALLYLCLTGGKGFRALKDIDDEPISFHAALALAETGEDSMVRFSDNHQTSNRMETLVVGSIVLASHKNGFAGIAFDAFFSALLYELAILDSADTVIDFPISVENVMVPFLAPVNVKWPSFLPQELHVGNLNQMKTTAQTDSIRISKKYSVECHDMQEVLTNLDMTAILERVPESSFIHVGFTKSLQRSYFRKGGFEAIMKRRPSLQSSRFYHERFCSGGYQRHGVPSSAGLR